MEEAMITRGGHIQLFLGLVLTYALGAGCSAPRETVQITERAPIVERAPNTEQRSNETTSRRVYESSAETASPGVASGRFDRGKMWTFDDPPLEYFKEAYGFDPGQRWFDKARLSALRFATYCSASFVSADGLVLTNHHCGRESVTKVSKPGEDLLDNGFYAESLDDERKVDGLFVDQLISISDVTDRVYKGVDEDAPADQQVASRETNRTKVEEEMTNAVQKQDTLLSVQVIELYNGGKYSAYTFRRYHDVRLVMAPELQIGFFGGDWDNFTYPRYNLDMSFFRVYDADGEPLRPENYFRWSAGGAREGDLTFVIGNPGSTSRLSTVAQLEFERDAALPQAIRVIKSRSAVLKSFIDTDPVAADSLDLRNTWFSLENSLKANEGQLSGLEDEAFMARKRAGDEKLSAAIRADSSTARYRDVFDKIADIQISKRAVANQSGAFTYFSSDVMTSHILLRGLYGYIADILKQRGAPESRVDEMKKGGLGVSDWPAQVEQGYISARLAELRDYLGAEHPTVRAILKGSSPDSVAARLVRETSIADSSGFAAALESGYLASGDVTVPVVQSLAELYFSLGQQLGQFEDSEKNLNAQLGRAQFAVYGTEVPPDASFSLRIADGVISGYQYNGTKAPIYTTFYGMYDRFHSFEGDKDWTLPKRWTPAPAALDLSTPVNIISTNDITGGNSGSPMVNRNLEIVGLVFDSNIEALPNEYMYLDETGRTISVDSRGIVEAIQSVYGATRLANELRGGELGSK